MLYCILFASSFLHAYLSIVYPMTSPSMSKSVAMVIVSAVLASFLIVVKYFLVNAASLLASAEGTHSVSKTGYVHPFFSFSATVYRCPTALTTVISLPS